MSSRDRTISLGRRGVILGGLGAAVTGCSTGGGTAGRPDASASTSASGPVINSQQLGNVITTEDLGALEARLTESLVSGDWETFRTYLHRYDDHDLWRRILAGYQVVPMDEARFYVQQNSAKMNNASGGAVEATIDLALVHQIRGCDAQPLAQTVTAKVRKPKGGGPVTAISLDLREGGAGTSAWQLASVVVLESPHVLLLAREQDERAARTALPAIERGAARAMNYLSPPVGVSKLCVTLIWPDVRERLFGGSSPEAAGTAHRLDFVDPQELANAGGKEIEGQPFAGSRITLEPSVLSSPAGTEQLAAHEAIHALALKWGAPATKMYTEGYAEWFGLGGAQGFSATTRPVARASFGGFRTRQTSGNLESAFYGAQGSVNYACSAAVFSWAEEVHGADAPRALAEAAYTRAVDDPAKSALGMSEDQMLTQVASWL